MAFNLYNGSCSTVANGNPIITFLGDPDEKWEPLVPIFIPDHFDSVLCRENRSEIPVPEFKKNFFECEKELIKQHAHKRFVQ